MDFNERTVEVSYQVISEALGILTVALFIDNTLMYIFAGKKEIMILKLKKIFG